MSFSVAAKDPKTQARTGVLKTAHGEVETPVFMPVATQGTIKALSVEDLESLGFKAILSNSYHLYLRPGTAIIAKAGGLHKFMTYEGMILTDSGGFQVMSLSDFRKIEDDGVEFKSHIDGSRHKLTPEKVIEIQRALGADCWTTLDECPPYPCTEAQAKKALERTMRWTDKSIPALKKARDQGVKSLFFPILQGSVYPELRKRGIDHILTTPLDGVALGGFSVGEPKEMTWSVLERTIEFLPEDKPRYLMGVGTPADLWEAVARGVDMLDSVFPTRVARNGQVMTVSGRYNIANAPSREDFGPLCPECACFVCRRYSRAYLHHIFKAKELTSFRLLSYHNLHTMNQTILHIRSAIRDGAFDEKKRRFLDRMALKMA